MAERNLDFDRIINRKNTDCLKYDFAVKRGIPADVLPLWVADMDFETSSYIEDALVERAKMGIYGYSDAQTPYFEAVAGWMKRHHNWQPKEEWLIKTPGVVFALAIKIIVMIMGLFGFANMWIAVFADTGVSVLCLLNSIRILHRK
mgnify:CR=1 FL=1